MSISNPQIPKGLKHVVHFYDSVSEKSYAILYNTILAAMINHEASKIELIMSSTGGNIHVGMTAYGFLSSLPIHLTTININSVESISVLLFLAGKERLCKHNARFLIHEFSHDLSHPVGYNRFKEMASSLESDFERYVAIFQERTQSAESPVDIRKCLGGEALIVNASEAISNGICTDKLTNNWTLAMPADGAYHWKIPISNG